MVLVTGHKARAASAAHGTYAQNIAPENMMLIMSGHYDTSDTGMGWKNHGVLGRQTLDFQVLDPAAVSKKMSRWICV